MRNSDVQQPAISAELEAIATIEKILEPLDHWARERVMQYVASVVEQRNVWGEEKKRGKGRKEEE